MNQYRPTIIEVLASDIKRIFNRQVMQTYDQSDDNYKSSSIKHIQVAVVALQCITKGLGRELTASIIHDTIVQWCHEDIPLKHKVVYGVLPECNKYPARLIHDLAMDHNNIALTIACILNDDLSHEIPLLPFVNQVPVYQLSPHDPFP